MTDMTLNADTMKADSAPRLPSDKELEGLQRLVSDQVAYEEAIVVAEEVLNDLKRLLREVSEHKIPDAMSAMGLSSLSLSNGSAVDVKKITTGSIKKDDTWEVYAELTAMGHGDLIKNIVTATFGSGEDEQAREAVMALEDVGLVPDVKRSIHPGTLGAFVREQLAEGRPLPEKLTVYHGYKTKITRK